MYSILESKEDIKDKELKNNQANIELLNFIKNICIFKSYEIEEVDYNNYFINVKIKNEKEKIYVLNITDPFDLNFFNFDNSEKTLVFTLIDKADSKWIFAETNNIKIYYKQDFIYLKEKYPSCWLYFLMNTNIKEYTITKENNNYFINLETLFGMEKVMVTTSILEQLKIIIINEFSQRIKNETPCIFVGNGASIPFGSDSWPKLTENMLDYLNPFYLDNVEVIKNSLGNSLYTLGSLTEELMPNVDYNNALANCIYRKYNKIMHNNSTIIRAITEIKYLRKEMPLITYNYDKFIENDYYIFYNQTLNSVNDQYSDKMNNEPKIKHVHGLLDNSNSKIVSKNIILTEENYNKVYNNINRNWVTKTQIDVLKNNVCLYVGSSMTDMFQNRIIEFAYNNLEKTDKSPYVKCFAILRIKDLSIKDKIVLYIHYLRRHIAIISVNDFSEIPKLLRDLLL